MCVLCAIWCITHMHTHVPYIHTNAHPMFTIGSYIIIITMLANLPHQRLHSVIVWYSNNYIYSIIVYSATRNMWNVCTYFRFSILFIQEFLINNLMLTFQHFHFCKSYFIYRNLQVTKIVFTNCNAHSIFLNLFCNS